MILVADEPGGREGIGAQHEIIERRRPFLAIPLERRLALRRVDIDKPAGQLRTNAELFIDAAELGRDLPDAAFDEAVITAEDRPGIHER